MIDEKKLLENVVEMFHCVPLISNGKREEYFDDILERQPKIEQPQLNQWHVVADGDLPKEETTVLVKLSNGEVITGGVLYKEWYLGNVNVFWDYLRNTVFYEDNIAIVEWKEI